ncbi:MAG: hypothetical protein KBS86_02475 [Proteobacteria bacterium]|nr:hypothetical protein [Candidatus Enterousia scatequi]
MANGWDASTLKKLKTLFERGLSTAEIGRKLGISKNAVVGKINRLGWNSNKSVVVKAKPKAAPAKKAPAKASKVAPKQTTKNAKVVKKTVTQKKAPVKTQKSAPKPNTKEQKNSKANAKSAPKSAAPVKTASKKTNKDLAIHQRIIQHSLEMANLKPNQCRWPIGDPDSEHFHFCGAQVFTGKPYCYEHCRQAYQFTPPKKK